MRPDDSANYQYEITPQYSRFGAAQCAAALAGVLASYFLTSLPAQANGAWADFSPPQGNYYSAGAAGDQLHRTRLTRKQARQDITPDINSGVADRQERGQTFSTGTGTLNAGDRMGAFLPKTRTTQYGGSHGERVSLGSLPPTTLSSFVADSGKSEEIYGDEGGYFEEFTAENTIGRGLDDADPDHELSTGHDSELPSTWLGDAGTGSAPVVFAAPAVAPAFVAELSVQ